MLGGFADLGSAVLEFFGIENKAVEAPAVTALPEAKSASAAKPVIAETTARESAPSSAPPSRTASGATPAPRPAVPGGGNIAPQFSFSLNFSGVPSKDVGDVLVGAVKSKERELAGYFEKMLADIASNQRRLAYAS
jgi:hypothetical protein